MPKFKDKSGDEWTLALDVGTLGKLRRDADFVLTKQGFPKEITGLEEDCFKFGAVLWTLCEAQAKERNITPEAFAYRFDGDTIQAAAIAFTEAAIDFFLPAKARESLKAKIPALLAKAEQEAETVVNREAEKLLKMPPGSLLESLESMPTR